MESSGRSSANSNLKSSERGGGRNGNDKLVPSEQQAIAAATLLRNEGESIMRVLRSATQSLASTPKSQGSDKSAVGSHASMDSSVPGLLRLLSPFRSNFEELAFLGRGGFGSVIKARSLLDQRTVAVKRVPFRSRLPPWAPLADLEKSLGRALREVRALCRMERSPFVTRYYWAWVEPDWAKLTGVLGPTAVTTSAGAPGIKVSSVATSSASGSAAKPSPGTRVAVISEGAEESDSSDASCPSSSASASSMGRTMTQEAPQSTASDSVTASEAPSAAATESHAAPSESFGISFRDTTSASSGTATVASASTAGARPAKAAAGRTKGGRRALGRMDETTAPTADSSLPRTSIDGSSSVGESEGSGGGAWGETEGDSSWAGTDGGTGDTGPSPPMDQLVPFMMPKDAGGYPFHLFISMECIEGPTLDVWMSRRPRVPMTLEASTELLVFRQLVLGILHIHSCGIIHRDIKPSNIFVIQDKEVRIGDFGLAVLLEGPEGPTVRPDPEQAAAAASAADRPEGSRTIGMGTASYCAPEQLQGPGLYGSRVDLYPLGLILVELFTPISTGMERARILQDARNCFLPASLWNMYPEVGDLATRLLFADPGSRITAAQALQHPALNGPVYEGPGSTGSSPRVTGPLDAAAGAAIATFAVEEASEDGLSLGAEPPMAAAPHVTVAQPSPVLAPAPGVVAPPSPLLQPASQRPAALHYNSTAAPSPSKLSLALRAPLAAEADPFERGPVFVAAAPDWPSQALEELAATARALDAPLALLDPEGSCLSQPGLENEMLMGSLAECVLSLNPATVWRLQLGPLKGSSVGGKYAEMWPWEVVKGCFDGRNVLIFLTASSGPEALKPASWRAPPSGAFGRNILLRSAAPSTPLSLAAALASCWSAAQGLRETIRAADFSQGSGYRGHLVGGASSPQRVGAGAAQASLQRPKQGGMGSAPSPRVAAPAAGAGVITSRRPLTFEEPGDGSGSPTATLVPKVTVEEEARPQLQHATATAGPASGPKAQGPGRGLSPSGDGGSHVQRPAVVAPGPLTPGLVLGLPPSFVIEEEE